MKRFGLLLVLLALVAGLLLPLNIAPSVQATNDLILETTHTAIFTADPTFTDTANDGYVRAIASSWVAVHSATSGDIAVSISEYYGDAMSTQYGTATSKYYIWRSFFYFDTSSLPDNANITSVVFRIRGNANKDSSVSAQKGTQADTLTTASYNDFSGSEYGHSIGWSISTTEYNEIIFNAQGKADINLAGVTKICCREYDHDYLNIGSTDNFRNGGIYYEHGVSSRPELVVTYEASVAPTITTNNATYVTLTTAQLNAHLDDDGGEACDVRFQYTASLGGDYENFTNYTEVDPNGRVTVTANKSAYAGLQRNDPDTYVYDDKGADYFSGNFEHQIDVNLTAADATSFVTIWGLANLVDGGGGIVDASGDELYIYFYNSAGTKQINLREVIAGTAYTDPYVVSLNTSYYLTIGRDESVGTYGQLTCAIYNDTAKTDLADTLSLNLHEKEDFRYVYVTQSFFYDGAAAQSGYCENLTLGGIGGNWTSTDWINDTYVTSNTPYVNIEGLDINTTYYFRAQVRNDAGIDSGDELSFTTSAESADPTNLMAYPSCRSVSLTWTKGINTTNTMVRAQVGQYPTNYTSGEQVYFGTMSTATHSGLTSGTNYYYRAWGESGGNYTDNYTQVMVTTPACGAASETPGVPERPTGWFGSPDSENLENLPFYSIVNDLADDFGMPHLSFWLLLMLFAATLIGLFVYRLTNNAPPAILAVGVVLTVLLHSLGGLLWIIFAVGIVATGVFVAVRQI